MPWKIIVIILAIIIVLLLAVGYYVFTTVFDSRYNAKGDENPDLIDSEGDLMKPTARRLYAYRESCLPAYLAQDFEEVSVRSLDGLKLHGLLVEGNPKEVVIMVHGYRSKAQDDFCDRFQIYRDRGSTMLFVDDRGHGKSEGRYFGFSETDRFDVGQWIDFINKRYDNPRIYLHGVSMGGATVIHCADMHYENVCGIVDDCGFNSILGISQYLIGDMYHMPYMPVGYLAWLWSLILNGVSFNKSVGEKCVAHTDIPIVFIHGTSDAYVPCRMSESMYEACASPKELHLIEDCGHAAAYMMAPEEYTAAVNRLLDGKIK